MPRKKCSFFFSNNLERNSSEQSNAIIYSYLKKKKKGEKLVSGSSNNEMMAMCVFFTLIDGCKFSFVVLFVLFFLALSICAMFSVQWVNSVHCPRSYNQLKKTSLHYKIFYKYNNNNIIKVCYAKLSSNVMHSLRGKKSYNGQWTTNDILIKYHNILMSFHRYQVLNSVFSFLSIFFFVRLDCIFSFSIDDALPFLLFVDYDSTNFIRLATCSTLWKPEKSASFIVVTCIRNCLFLFAFYLYWRGHEYRESLVWQLWNSNSFYCLFAFAF